MEDRFVPEEERLGRKRPREPSAVTPVVASSSAASSSAAAPVADVADVADVAPVAAADVAAAENKEADAARAEAAADDQRSARNNPAYGNSSRDAAIIVLLRKFGFADFRHDFNEKTATRDLITPADLKRFMEILQRYSVDSRVKATATFKNIYQGKTLYDLLRTHIGDVLYPSNTKTFQNPEKSTDDLHEEAVMAAVGLNYPELKTAIKGLGGNVDRKLPGEFNFGVSTKRGYTIRAQTYKYDAATRNLSSLFMDVTGGKTKFAVIIDATGGLSTSSFADARLLPAPKDQFEFIIINNLENDADSADKLKHVKPQGGVNPPVMKTLRDTESTAVYPVWTTEELADGANIFSGVRIILNRTAKGEVEADMFFPNEIDLGGGKKINAGTTYNIGDLSETSNVKNATLNAVATLMMEPNHPGKPFLYALIKRMGDWCQALSLLDRSRPYLIKSKIGDPGTPTTLGELSVTHEVGIVTNDRILLAYSLMLGLNVFFTSGSDISSLIYFKNNSDIPDGPALAAALVPLRNSMETSLKEAFGDTDPATLITAAKQAIVSPGIQEYINRAMLGATNQIADLFGPKGLGIPVNQNKNTWRNEFGNTVGQAAARLFAYNSVIANLGSLRNGYDGMVKGLADALKDDTEGAADMRKQFAALNRIISIASNFTRDQEYNKGVLARLDACSFADSAAKLVFIRTMITKIARTGTDPTGNVKSMVLAMRDDFTQMANSGMFSIQDIINSIPQYGGVPGEYKTYTPSPSPSSEDEKIETLKDTYKGFINAIILLSSRIPAPAAPAPLKGGGPAEVTTAYNALRQFKVRISNGVTPETDGIRLDALAMAPNDQGKSLRADILDSVREATRVYDPEIALMEVEREKARYAVAMEAPVAPAEVAMKDGGGHVMKGGNLFAMGVDTPVFNKNDPPVGGWNGFPVMLVPTKEELEKLAPADIEKEKKKTLGKTDWFSKTIETYDPVVRMVSSGDGEISIHRTLKDMVDKNIPPFDDPFVKMHMNLWVGLYRVNYAETEKKVAAAAPTMLTRLQRVNDRFGNFKWYGLVTRTQKMDIGGMLLVDQISPLCDILRTLLHINGRVVHFDLHSKNMAVMRDGTAVIHDVGRMKLRDFGTNEAPWDLVRPITSNKRVLRNVLANMFTWPNEFMDYSQYFYIARAFMDLRKDGAVGGFHQEPYPKREAPHWIQEPVDPNPPANQKLFEANLKRFEEWLDEFNENVGTNAGRKPTSWVQSFAAGAGVVSWLNKMYDESGKIISVSAMATMDPRVEGQWGVYFDHPFETRYYQIARIFDILSVLAVLSHTAGTGRIAYHYARKAAVDLIKLLHATPPAATKENVGKVVREFLSHSGTIREMKNDAGSETEAAKIYWLNANDPRSGKKPSAPAPAPAPAPVQPEAAAEAEAALLAALEDARLAQGSSLPKEQSHNLEVDIEKVAKSADERKTKGKGESVQVEDKNIGAVVMSPTDVDAENKVLIPPPPAPRSSPLEEGDKGAVPPAPAPAPAGGRRTFRRKGLPQLL